MLPPYETKTSLVAVRPSAHQNNNNHRSQPLAHI
ncbi:unnamed protein product [Arabidopsis lyrata]|nr:unnamed protein product [Arabidopsis lyrata]